MKKAINIEPGEVFTLLTAGKDVYCVLLEDTISDKEKNERKEYR